MCKVCKRRKNFLLHADEEKRSKKSIKEISVTSARILPRNIRGKQSFRNLLNERWYDNIVLSIPHSSIDGLATTKWNDKAALLKEVRRWTDWYTDLIFVPDQRDKIKTVVSDYSRFVVDVERLLNDPMEKIGQGILYTDFNGIHRAMEKEEEMGMIAYYMGYIKTLKEMLNEHSLLIDCHSFPSDLSEFDICIGFNDDWSRPSDFIIDLVVEFFKKKGYKVSINSPYSNAIAPETNFVYNSIMIEINKKVYLNEQSLELTDNANILREQLSKLYRILLRYNEEFVIKDHGKKQL